MTRTWNGRVLMALMVVALGVGAVPAVHAAAWLPTPLMGVDATAPDSGAKVSVEGEVTCTCSGLDLDWKFPPGMAVEQEGVTYPLTYT